MPDNVDKLFEIMQAKGAASDRGKFRKVFLTPGNKGYKIRKDIYDGLRADGIIDSPTYEDFRRKLRLGGTPTVNKYRQQMFSSVDPNKSRASELTHRAVGQAVRATNNVRKPVTAKVVNRKGKPTGEEFAITPAKTVEDLDREYAQETTKNWENELNDQMADADKDAAKISDMFKSFIGSTDEVGSVWGNMTRGGGIAGTPHSVTTNNGILENTEARQILAAGDYNRKRRELLQLEQDSRNGAIFDNHSFFRGMYDAAKDTGFLTGGASDLINAGSLLATKQDLDNGVHTEAGDMLMQQAVKNSDAQSQYGDNQGWMYTGGVITTNMAPFMMQVASAGFSKGMSNAIGKVVQGAASKVALGTMEKATGMAGAHIANYIGKVTGLTTKAFGKAIQYGIVGAAQANTVGLGNVANDVINRYTGQVYQDEKGNYKFGTFDSDGKLVHEGGEDFLTALVKGDAAQTIEFATELAGGGIDAVGTALKNFVSKGGKKIINKYNMENVSKVIDFLLNNKVSKNARYLKAGADRTLGKVELNSIVGESLEEELGIIANTVFTGDNKISDLWDEKQQSQIWGGMLLSIGLMKGAVAPFHAYNTKQYYSYKHKLDKADVNLSQLLGKEKWEELRNQIDATTNDDMPEMVNKINRDVALGKNRQPVREYIQNLLIMRGYDIGNMLAAKKAVEDKGEGVSVKNMEKNQAYQQGRDAYGYDTHEIQLDQEDKQKSLAQLLGISEHQLASMSDEELEALSGHDDNIDRAIYDYQLSTARYEGVIDNARDQIDLEVQRAAQAVDMYTDKSRNTIRNATIKATGGLEDYGVYIINGNIATHEDGSIDISNSDDMILYYDPTTNTVEHADAMMFAELGSEENADEVRSQAMDDAKEKAIKETTGIIDGVVEVGTQFKTVDADGTEHTYEVLADNGDGTAVVTIDGNVPTELVKGENVQVPFSFEELQKMKDASDQQRLQAAKAQREQMEKERAEQQMQAQTTQAENPSQEDNIQPAPIEDNLDYSDIIREDGKVQMVDVSDKDGNNLFPDAKDVFYIQGNKMRTKFAYIDANGELKTQSFPTGLVKIKTRGEVSVDDYKKYRATILSAESSTMPETSMIEDNSGTIEANRGGVDVEDNTQPLSEADADNVIAQMESSAETAPDLELTPDNWTAEFGEDGILSTPIGDVKMGENQVAKLFEKGRSKEFGMIKPTLTNPDVIIEVPSHSADGNEERSSSYLFIKTFLGKNGKKVYYFKSVTIKKDGLEISISSHYDRVKRVKEALMKGKLLYRKNDGAQTEQNQPSASVTTSQEDAAGSSESKDTNISSNGNENNESLTFEDGTPIPVDMNGEVDLSQTDASHAAEWYDNNLGEDADDWLDGEIKKAKKVLEQAKNKKLAGTKPSELVASKKEKEAAIADAQAHYDSAISIRDSLKERRIAKEENTSEGRRNLIEKARRKFARLKSAVKNDAEAVAQIYKETVGTLLHRLYDGTGIDVTDTIPLTAEEYVASNLGAHSLNYEGTETSKGVKQETGLSRKDFAETQLLAADGKGTTIDNLVHSLWENRPSNLDSLDTQDIRNALLSIITSGFKASEARNYIENLRIARAENFKEEEKKAADNAAFAKEQKAKQEEEDKKAEENAEEKAEEKTHSESFNKIVDLAKNLEEILDNPDNVKEIDKITHEIDELLENLSDKEFKEVSDVLLNIDEDLEYLTADEYERREGVEESKKAKAYNESLQQAIKRISPYADALKAAVKSDDKKAIAKARKELTDALLASNLGHGYLSGQLEYAKSAKKKDESYSERRALVKPLTDAIDAIESALDSALAEAGLEGVHVDFTEGGHGWIYADKGSAWSSRLKALDNDYRNVSQYETQNPISVLPQVTIDNVEKVAGIIKSRIEEGERYNSDEYNDEDEQTKFPDKLKEGSETIEVPEDATDEKPLGEQISKDKVPFEIKGEKSGETYDINDKEDRKRLVAENSVDDKDILDIDMPKHVHKAIKELCKKMGLKVQFLYMGARLNGWVENGTMYLALDANKAIQCVFGHEMTHAIKQKNPEAYKELVKVAMAVTTKKEFEEDLAKIYRIYHNASGYNNIDDFVEEVIADNIGKFINDHDLAQRFVLRLNHPVLATILHAIQKIKGLLYGDPYKSVDALERIVEKAYVDTANGQVTNSETGEDVSFSLRQKPEPKKKGIGYKVFVLKDGKLYPPMVANPDGAATPVGVWLDADAAPIAGESKTGRPQVKQGGKGTQGGSGKLAYRPGWHLGVVPYAIQFNRKDAEGNKTLFPKNFVFAEVEYAADVDYQEEARQEGINPSGKYQHSLAGLKHLPTDGYYMYRTNPNPETDPWVITGAMKVNRILTRAEQADLVSKAGREPQQIQEGDIVTDDVVNSINQEIADAPKFSIKTYHGSQASFDKFDHSFMGSGEGAQAYGWGTYVSEVEGIAKAYAKQNTAKRNTEYTVAKRAYEDAETEYKNLTNYIADSELNINMYNIPSLENNKKKLEMYKEKGIQHWVEVYEQRVERGEKTIKEERERIEEYKLKQKEAYKLMDEAKKKLDSIEKPKRNLYSVDIPDDTGRNYIGWDEPLGAAKIMRLPKVFKADGWEYKKVGMYDTYKIDGNEHEVWLEPSLTTGKELYRDLTNALGSDKAASEFLSKAGFVGVKVIAQRNTGGNKKGKMNYVIFDENNAQITSHTKFSLRLKSAIDETETNPSDAQKESGNYKKGHIKFGGYDYTIENPKGSTRSGKDADGKEWKVTMHDTYGYIRGKFGKDGDHLDMFINDKADLDNWNGDVFVVDQVNPDGSFDEHKVMYGYDSMDDAKKAYLANYSDGWKGLGNITGASKEEFDKWLDTSNRKLKPFADYANVKFSLKKDGLTPEIANTPVNIVDADEEHGFKNYAEAREWAKKNIVRTYNDEETGGKGEINISNTAVGKYLSEKAVKKSANKDVHMSVLKVLPSILRESVDAIQHVDRNKVGNERSEDFGVNPDVMIHRCYGAVNIGDKVYGVKITLKENVRTHEKTKLYSYEATKIELLDGQSGDVAMTSPRNSNNSITVAKIIKGFETTKKNGEKVDVDGTKYSLKDEEYLKAVEDGNMEKAQKMVNEAADAAGYSTDSSYQGTSAFNGAAPWGNGYFLTKDERKEAWDNGEFEGESTLGDYINDDIDGGNLEELTNAASYRAADPMRKEAIDNVRNAIQKKAKTITMYRSVPSDVKEGSFRNGDWVTPSRAYAVDNAKLHGWGDDYNIIEQKVPVDDVWFDGNDIAEWGYGREEDYINDTDFAYKNSKNNKKLLDAVTYDDNGNVIPLSQRFNEKNNDVRFSLKDEKTLVGVHNISEEKLLKAIKQGGLANPSVAVIDSSRQDHKAYGGISLIMPSDKIAKRTGKNAGTWQGDAYTPTYPQVERQMSNKGAEKASKDVSSVPSDMYSEVRRGLDRWLDGGEANSAMAYMFLHEKGVVSEPKKIQPKFSDEAYNELKFITAGDFNIYGIGKADAQKVLDMYIEAKFDGDKDLYEEKTKAWLERNKSIVDAGAKGGMRYAIAKENVELYDEYGFNYKGVQSFVRDVEYDHRKTGVDTDATLNEVENYIKTNNLTDEFNTWLEGKEKEYGIKEVIFDGFTPSGNRRYVPNTLENVSKIMKKQGRNGATGAAVSFQNFAARLMPSYGTLNDIRSKRDLLTSDREKFDKFREKWSNVFFELGMKCQPDATGTFADYGLARLSEAAMTSDPQAYLKKEYNVDFSDEDTKRLKEMVKAIKEEHPAMYFETKFERPVSFDEFSAAVVPTTTKKEVKDVLKNAGVSIFEYDEKSDADRSRAFNEAINSSDNIRFSLAGERGAAAADKAEERTFRMDNLSVAKDMEKNKKKAKAIKAATGWERGADGKWRYEMPDVVLRDPKEWVNNKTLTLSDIVEKPNDLFKEYPELFDAYPKLKDVKIQKGRAKMGGSYYDNTITLNLGGIREAIKYDLDIHYKIATRLLKRTLVHEVQHYIQHEEGFAKGGSEQFVRDAIKDEFEKVIKQIRGLRAEGKEDEAKALAERNKALYNAYANEKDSYKNYKSLSGEVEARNVSARLNMTPEERRKTLAESTEDVARKDQIFLGVGDVSFSLRDMADGKESGAADMAEDLKSLNTPDEVDDAIKTAIDDMPSGWQMANKKMIHIVQALGENRKAEIAGEEPKFSLKDGTLIKAGTYFSGGGLVEEGLKGIIDPVLAVEYDEKISGVYRNNFGQHIVTADVRDVDPKELVKQIDGEVEYFHASPVCKNYSQAKSNHAEVELDKETAASTAEFINAIKPKVVTIENVKGYKDSEAMKTITDALDANGYTWDADVYNAADYGGYTNRERLIVRAVRDGKLPAKPEKMARKSGWYEAVADIIPTLTEKKNGVAPWMDIRLKADGIDWRNIDKPLYVMGSAYADGKVPHAFADELLPTLRTKSGDVIVMPDGKVYRAMGRVLARVSGVSDDYKMPFSENLSHTIIGNGIPTQLTEHVIAPLLQNTLRPTTPDEGNTKFSLRGSTPYGKQMEEWMEKNHLEKGAVPMEKPIMKEGENIFDYANRMVEWTRNQNLWKTAPKQTGFQDALDKWKADNGLSPDAYPPVRPHRENYSTEIGYAEDLEEYNKKKELWKSAPKPKDFDLSVDLEDMNKQLRNIRRAVLNQKNYDQRTVKAVSDLVRKMLNIGWGDGLSRGKVGNLLSAAKNATGANDVKKYLDKAMGILAENYLNRLSTAYDNLINTKGARADQSGVIKMGSLDAKGQAFMSEYKKAMNMDDKSLNTYIANIEEDSAKNEDNVEMNDYRLAGIQAAIMYKQQIGGNDADISELQRQIGELKNKKDATKEDKDLLKSLEKKLFENKFDRITMYENLLNNIQRMVKESKGRAKEFREEIAEHKNEILHRANLDLEGVDSAYYDTTTAKKKFVNNPILRFVMSSTYTFEQFLKFFGRHHANGEGYLYNYFMSEWQDAADEQQLYNEMNRNALDEKTKELFGKKNFTKLVGIDGKGMKEMDVEVTDYSNKETGKRTIHLKQGQMLYIYLVNKETDGEMKLRAMGITEEKVAEIEENLDPRVKAMGEWLQDEYLPECQRRYQATHTKYFGAPMKEVENYFPLAINNRARNIREDLNQDTDAISRLAGTSTGAIITRRVNVIPLDIENADAFAVAYNHLDEMEEWSAYLPFIQDVNTLLSSTHFRNQVMNMSSAAYGSGKTLWEEFKKVAQIAAGTYKPKVDNGMMDSKIAAVVGGIATAKISGRLWTAFKQTQSATTFLTECDPARFLWYGVNPYGSWHWAYDNLPLFRKRVEQLTAGDVKVRQFLDELEKYHDWTKTIAKVGMSPNILVDSVTCAVGARSVYETELNKLTKLGYSKDKAEEKAIQKASLSYNKTQQSSEGAFLSPMQVDRTYVSAALSLYKNANYAYGRKKIEAIRGIAKTYRFWGEHKNAMIGSMTRQIMDEDGLDENVANAIAKRAYTRTFWYNIGTLLNYMTIVPISWAAYKVLLYLLNGDDDDKKKKMIEEACLKGFATTTFDDYVIPFASNVLNAGLNIEDGKIGFDTDVFKYQNLYINPATSDLSNIYSMIGNQKWWSAGNKLGMLGIQMLVGFNPETIGALYQAYDEFDKDSGNMPLEIKLAVLKSISAPEESIRGLYMDELGLDNEDRTKVPLSVLEQRYAERQINRDNLLSQIAMPKETFDGYVEKYKKSFEKKIQEKMDKMDAYDQRKFDAIFDTTTDPALKDMIEKKRTKDANAAADEQIAKEGLNQEKKGKEPSEEAYDTVKMSIDVAEDNAISTYNKVLNKRYAALNDEYNNQTDAMKYIFMSKHPNFKAYKDLESEYTTYGKKMKELKEKLVFADGYDAKQTILKQIRAEREKFSELQSKVR